MNVTIGEVSSTVRTSDSHSVLSPEVLDHLTAILTERIREELRRDKRLEAERRLSPGLDGTMDLPWESI